MKFYMVVNYYLVSLSLKSHEDLNVHARVVNAHMHFFSRVCPHLLLNTLYIVRNIKKFQDFFWWLKPHFNQNLVHSFWKVWIKTMSSNNFKTECTIFKGGRYKRGKVRHLSNIKSRFCWFPFTHPTLAHQLLFVLF